MTDNKFPINGQKTPNLRSKTTMSAAPITKMARYNKNFMQYSLRVIVLMMVPVSAICLSVLFKLVCTFSRRPLSSSRYSFSSP